MTQAFALQSGMQEVVSSQWVLNFFLPQFSFLWKNTCPLLSYHRMMGINCINDYRTRYKNINLKNNDYQIFQMFFR